MQRVNKPNSSDKTFLVIQDPEMSIEKLSKNFEKDRATAALLYKTADAIITEHDIVKLVASGKDAASTTVESIMTKGPVCVIANAKPVEILETMKKARFRHVPQVNNNGQVVDIIDIVNVAQQLHEEQQNNSRSSSAFSWFLDKIFAPETNNTAVNNWSDINFDNTTIDDNNRTSTEDSIALGISKMITIEEAAKEMLKRKTSGLLVIDLKTGTLEGIFCESDIVRKVISRGLNPSQTPVRAAMTIKPTTLNTETTKPLDALNLMLEKRFRHLPVADNDNRATGLHSILNLTFEVLGSRFIDDSNNYNHDGEKREDTDIIHRGMHTYRYLVKKWENEFANNNDDAEDEEETETTNDQAHIERESSNNNNTETVVEGNAIVTNKFNEKMGIALKKSKQAKQYLQNSEFQQAKKSFSRCILHFKQAEKYMDNDQNRLIMDRAKADIHFRLGETNFLMSEYSDALSDYQQVEGFACSDGRSFDNLTAIKWMVETGVDPEHLFTSKIQALCQLKRYEDAVEVLCIVKNSNELCQSLLQKVLIPVINQEIDNGHESFEKQKWDDATVDFTKAKRFLKTLQKIQIVYIDEAKMTLNIVDKKLKEVSEQKERENVQPKATVKKELSELAFLMSAMTQNENNPPAPVVNVKPALATKTKVVEDEENNNVNVATV